MRTTAILIAIAGVVFADCVFAHQQAPAPTSPASLVNLGLEDLMRIEVTSVSKRPERLLDAAASIYVITAEEIRRSGVTSLPEALRLAPNLEVAQATASGYAITARGFNGSSANKLLVLIDGRSVYTPLFSGVFWDAQDVVLEDVERIEVISGPGGTLWGVNAVNGVINVITRSAKDTLGGLLTAGGGNRETDSVVRYGDSLSADGNYRVFGKYFDRNHTMTASGDPKSDSWHQGHAGFRAEWRDLTILGNAYKGTNGQPLPGTVVISGLKLALGAIPIAGANLVGRWKHVRDSGSVITVQSYYDLTERTVPPTFAERLAILDLLFEHILRPIAGHSLSWGGEYRYGMDRVVNSPYFAFLPAKVNQRWTSIFAEDGIALRKGLRLTVGGRVENNDYTGNEFLPNIRLAWKIAPDHLLWSAASRTVRAPSRFDRDVFVPGKPPFLLMGGLNVRSEIAQVYEVGYRAQHATSVTYSATLFYANYQHLRTQEIAPSRTFYVFGNGMEGHTSGLEIWSAYQATSNWRLSGGFTALREKLRLRAGSVDAAAVGAQEGRDPARSWRFRSSLDLFHDNEVDVMARRVSELSNPFVPAYTAVDLRYGWQPHRGLELSVTAQNLFARRHTEFLADPTRSAIGRGVFIKIASRLGRHD